MTKLHPTEPIATFTQRVTVERFRSFFDAVAWGLSPRPAAPPTIATIFRQGEFKALESLGIPVHKILHGEQKYRFHRDIEPEVDYLGETFITSHYERSGKSGSINFYVFQTNLKDPAGHLCVECHSTIVARGGKE